MATSNETMIQKCRDKVAETGENAFRIQISRKDPTKIMSSRVAVFEMATIDHLTMPETWLPKILGGGLYAFQISHLSGEGKATPIPGDLYSIHLDGRPFSNIDPVILDLVKAPDWPGPARLVWPSEKEFQAKKNEVETIATTPLGGGGGGNSAANASANHQTRPEDPRYEAAQRALEAEKLAWSEKVRSLDEAKHKLELDNLKREADARMAKLESKLEASAGAKTNTISEIIAAVSPIVTAMLSSQNDLRKEMLASDAKAREEQGKLWHVLLEKKEDAAPNKLFAALAENFAMMNKMSMDMLHTMKETIMGPEESTAVTVARELGKAFILMGQAGGGGPKLKPVPQLAAAPQAAQPEVQRVSRKAPKGKTDPIARVEAMIRARMDPEVVADAVLGSMGEPAMHEALAASGGNYNMLIQQRLGDWLLQGDNLAYLSKVGQIIQSRAEEEEEPEGEEEEVDASGVEGAEEVEGDEESEEVTG